MNTPSLISDNDPASLPSMPTLRGGGAGRPGEPVIGRIDHYDLLCKLGGGGFGVVYLARDSVSGIEVALKTLHPLLKTNAEEMDALREKFRLVARLTHTNIAKALVLHPVRDVNIWDETARKEMRLSPGDSVMVMDYAPGVTLSQWRRQFPGHIVPPDLALEIGRQLASALDYAHGERIVHRDIKPGNIMVETLRPLTGFQDGQDEQDAPGVALAGPGSPVNPGNRVHPVSKLRVRLLDFGLAAEIRSSMSRVSTETGDTSGTRPYMAPEQWLGRKQDGRTDQYALACVLYEMLSGAPPFAGVFETGDPIIMRTAVERDAPDEIEDLDPAINAALLRALSKAPKERFPSCAAFLAALSGEAEKGGASRHGEPKAAAAASEADILRRKVALSRRLAAVAAAERGDAELGALVSEADTELAAAEEAFKYTRFVVAAECLGRAEAALKQFDGIKTQRAEDAARRQARRRKFMKAAGVVAIMGVGLFAMTPIIEHARWVEIGRKAREEADRKTTKVLDLGGVTLEMVYCPGVASNFWMGKYEVTQEQWQRVMGGNPSYFKNKPKNPVETVSWNDCQEFVTKLNALPAAQASGLTFRLPMESEWEKACRAGAPTSADYCRLADGTQITASTLSRVARYDKGWSDGPVAVGSFLPNAWGLYDMHGNVWEWTSTADGDCRVFRGGGFNYTADFCSAGFRSGGSPGFRYGLNGLRLAASGRTAAQ